MNLRMSRKELIQKISEIGQASHYLQADNQLNCLIWEKRLPSLKKNGRVMQAQEETMEK